MRVRSSAPHVLVSDLRRSVDWFVDVLGFERPELWGDPPGFAMPERDGFIVMLEQRAGVEPRPHGAVNAWDAHFWSEGVDAFAAELIAVGADVVEMPVDRPEYWMRELFVRDPDGHLLVFGQDID